MDTNAKAKSDAKFTEIKTGNTELDKLLDKAISLGKSQQTAPSSSSSSQASSSSSTESATDNTSPSSSVSSNNSVSARDDSHGGLSSSGVDLQRASSRVPFNQSAVDDSNNSAWDFADGVLEQILATSRSRGYITGNQYILNVSISLMAMVITTSTSQMEPISLPLTVRQDTLLEMVLDMRMLWTTKAVVTNSFFSKS